MQTHQIQQFGVRLLLVLLTLLMPFSAAAQTPREVTVFAAATLREAFTEIARQFEAANDGVRVVLNFNNSAILATQIVEGAPADVFASANMRQMTLLVEESLTAEPLEVFASNRLVIIVPKDNPAQIETLRDLAKPNVKLILPIPSSPAREYAETTLEKLAALPAYGERYRQAVLANLVSEEQNVRQVIAKIALGEGDATILYPSDVSLEVAEAVATIEIPDEVNTFATFPIAALKNAAEPELARAFVAFVLSEEGQAIMAKWNFLPPPDPEPAATAEPSATPKR